jgi:hypothetical protein
LKKILPFKMRLMNMNSPIHAEYFRDYWEIKKVLTFYFFYCLFITYAEPLHMRSHYICGAIFICRLTGYAYLRTS